VQALELVRGGRLPPSPRRLEKLLKTPVHQAANFRAHDDSGALHDLDFPIRHLLENSRAAVPFHSVLPALGIRDGESRQLQALQTVLERDFFRAMAAKEHSASSLYGPINAYNSSVPFVLSLDEGTTSARAALYDRDGRVAGMTSEPVLCIYPKPGWVEQDAEQIWTAQFRAVRRLLDRLRVSPSEIEAVGIANQRETVIVWDRETGSPVAPAIVWQCRRTADQCDDIAESEQAGTIAKTTGLVIDAYFSATKIAWVLDHVADARRRAENGELLFGNVDTWLLWKLTSGAVHVTDVTNASRTMLMDLESGTWNREMLAVFGIPERMLPRIVGSCGVAGTVDGAHFGAQIPVAGIAGDQQAALAGQACFRAGLSKNTYGTGCFALMHTGSRRPFSANRLLATRTATFGKSAEYAIEGSVFVAGAAIQWLRDELGLISSASESEAVAESVPDCGGVVMVPAFVGLGAPHWDPHARGVIVGINRSTGRGHLVRAALESIALQTAELVHAMEADSGSALEELRVDGGGSVNNFLMQFQADILDRPVVRPADVETTALGAAYLAGLAVGFWSSPGEIESFWRAERRFDPRMTASERERRVAQWQAATAHCRAIRV
jgi:glycerol kinase